MKFIIRSVRPRPATNNSAEFDEFCESVLSVLDRSDFFIFGNGIEASSSQEQSPIAVDRHFLRHEPSLIQLFSALCVT